MVAQRRLEPDQRRSEILAVACGLFSVGSYPAVSTTDIAAEAGVARALINHYFGSKRELYLEVVRHMLVIPTAVTDDLPPTSPQERVSICVDRWLDVVEGNRDMWLSTIGSEALGRDPEIDRIMLEADEIAADRVLEAVMLDDVTVGTDKLRGLVRAHSSLLKAASREWLVRGALTRSDLHVMLTRTMLHLVHTVFPAVQGIGVQRDAPAVPDDATA